jgi:hypothetical protein
MNPTKAALMKIPNIGKSMADDLMSLGINSVADLAKQEPDELYLRLCQQTKSRQDPCVWDTFAAAIHFAKTGEAKKWWDYSEDRKKRGIPRFP